MTKYLPSDLYDMGFILCWEQHEEGAVKEIQPLNLAFLNFVVHHPIKKKDISTQETKDVLEYQSAEVILKTEDYAREKWIASERDNHAMVPEDVQ